MVAFHNEGIKLYSLLGQYKLGLKELIVSNQWRRAKFLIQGAQNRIFKSFLQTFKKISKRVCKSLAMQNNQRRIPENLKFKGRLRPSKAVNTLKGELHPPESPGLQSSLLNSY